MEYNKKRVYQIPVFNTGGGNGTPGDGVLLASDLGDWLDLPEKSLNIFDEQINIQYKLDMMSYPDKAILFLVGQFGIKPDFVGSELILGVLPLNTHPKHQLKQNFTCQSTECYLVIELNGEVKLQAISGDLPVTIGVSEVDPYFINVDYNPKIEDGTGGETFTAIRTQNFTRNNCTAGYAGTSVTFEKTYTSTVSQADANNQRANDANFATEGQAWANDPANGATCEALPVFSASRTQNFTRSNCAEGLIPGSIPFTKNYTSYVSQADADNQAATDPNFATEGQAYANDPINGATCSVRYYAQRAESFTRNNCDPGSTGSSVNFTKNYQSDISQADADNKAATDANFGAEGQAYANDPANGATCTVSICEPPTNVTVEDLGISQRAKPAASTIIIDTAPLGAQWWNARILISLFFQDGKAYIGSFTGDLSTPHANGHYDANWGDNAGLSGNNPELVGLAPDHNVSLEIYRFVSGNDTVRAMFSINPDGSWGLVFVNSGRSESGTVYEEGYGHQINSPIDFNENKIYLFDKDLGTEEMHAFRISYQGTGRHTLTLSGDTMFNYDLKETTSSPVIMMVKPDTGIKGTITKVCSLPPDYSDLSTPVNFNP
ncbi:DUF5977 domain-containing protein [Pedobacter vanadiisoli]|uniref:DUF5977 domain-containing protein n=1 Tax=Pedobacter vanadiisoli TaxID=1761975 RepID=A0ABW5ME29_9SPHI